MVENGEDIWGRWKAHYRRKGLRPDRFWMDGIINKDLYRKTHPRILFVMKEPNASKGGDLRTLFQDGPRYQAWHTIGRWAAGILGGFPPYGKVNDYETIKNAFARIATINLKKACGGSQSDGPVISAYAHHDRDLLLEQIEQIRPELLIACGTMEQVIWLLDLDVNPDAPWEPRLIKDKIRGMSVLPWRHPTRADNRSTYGELRKILGRSR